MYINLIMNQLDNDRVILHFLYEPRGPLNMMQNEP